MSSKILNARDSDVHVVSEDFLEAVKSGSVVDLIKEKSIANWGSEPLGRIRNGKSGKSGESRFSKSVSTVKWNLKGGVAVDPESGLQERAHVYKDEGGAYTVTLGKVDVQKGTNSFYKLQLLEDDNNRRYWLFRSWGRVGTTIGDKKIESVDLEGGIALFNELYEDKTGNDWLFRKQFKKRPNKFYPVDIDYGEDDQAVQNLAKLKEASTSKLPKAVQDLICLLFDVEQMKKTMLEFEIDMKKMPLGKLSKNQIKMAYAVLKELEKLIEENASETKFVDASNRFYTLIPHDFGLQKPPIINKTEIIKSKVEMLDSLMDMEVAYNIMKGADEDKTKDPIDSHYEKLSTNIEVLERAAEEFKLIETYVNNTHAATHQEYKLDIEQIYKVSRQGEATRYKPFKKLHNRKLLWHGSRTTNFVGILSQGLRIAPPEAPSTGYMFGKGIYFADMVSKSANYCYTSKSNPTGLMLLCEVALGNMHECLIAQDFVKPPPGKHSAKGVGRTAPDPNHVAKLEDVEVPLGKGVPTGIDKTSLLYNEYIVYDVSQVHIKYLLKMNFKHKY